jgi:hypothetical protein
MSQTKPTARANFKLPITYMILILRLKQEGTLIPSPNFNAEIDCEALKYAFKGVGLCKQFQELKNSFTDHPSQRIGTKEDLIINIMGNRSNDQRLQIKDMYKTMFGKVFRVYL